MYKYGWEFSLKLLIVQNSRLGARAESKTTAQKNGGSTTVSNACILLASTGLYLGGYDKTTWAFIGKLSANTSSQGHQGKQKMSVAK